MIGVADTCDAELIVLVVTSDPGEGDAVVDLRDLAEITRRVLGTEQHMPSLKLDCGKGLRPRAMPFWAKVRPVLHQLFGGNVERHVHGSALLRWWLRLRGIGKMSHWLDESHVRPTAAGLASW